MSRCVDLDERVTAQFYDEECEEWTMQTCTIADVLDSVCDEYTVLHSAQPEPQWIPFAEHRPWEGQQILVCSEDGVMWITVFRSLIGFSGAWLPLPEPYKGEP